MVLGLNFDLLDQLSFYGAYHRHPVNKAIHLVFVPLIVWSALVWMAGYVPKGLEDASLAGAFRLIPMVRWCGLDFLVAAAVPNLGALALLAYSAYYVALEPIAGTSWFVMCGVPLWLTASWMGRGVEVGARVASVGVVRADPPGPRRVREETAGAAGLAGAVAGARAAVRVDGGVVRVRVQAGSAA
jgi:uncharacterized membrane protein YGL010W